MSRHPLIQLSNDREVCQASEFREAAEGLTGEALGIRYQQEVSGAQSRRDAGLQFLTPYSKRLAGSRRKNRDEEHLSLALLDWARKPGAGLSLPSGAELQLAAAQVPLALAPPDKAQAGADWNAGVDPIDLIGTASEGCLAIGMLKFVDANATRPGVGDTPLRALLRALAHTAIAWANREAIAAEITAAGGPTVSEDTPELMLIASPRYWTLCRKREAQKGAGWIKQHERIAREIEEEIGVRVHYLAIDLEGDPGWSYVEGWPVLDAAPRLGPAWEAGAGRLKPKPRPKAQAETTPVIEADMTRPIPSYSLTEVFQPGDRIAHPTLGTGVVQGEVGPGKIAVLFEEKKSLLVHGRTPPATSPII